MIVRNKHIILAVGFLITFPLISLFAWLGCQYLTDPLDFIDQPIDELVVVTDSLIKVDFLPKYRKYKAITLKKYDQSEIKCLISMPLTISKEGLPVVVILGGLEVGKYTLKYIPDPGNNIIVTFQYPYHPEYWYKGTAIEEIPIIRASVLSVPSQVLSLIQWISSQGWADNKRLAITGYSFGALFVPAIYRLSAHHRMSLKYGVIAYGGVNLYQLLSTNMTNFSEPLRSLLSRFAAIAIRGIEPADHVPYMQGEFLVINGTKDHQIPQESWRELHRLIPDPKTIVILKEGHMHPRKTELTRRLVKMSHQWLIEKGIANY